MEKAIFTLLLVGSGIGVGLAIITAWMHFKLARSSRIRDGSYHIANAITKSGIALTSGVLLWRLAGIGAAEVTWASFAYLVGQAIVAIGLALQVRDLIAWTARDEVISEEIRRRENGND